MSTPTSGPPAPKSRVKKNGEAPLRRRPISEAGHAPRSRSCNPKATTVNVPCLPAEKKRWTAAAAVEAAVLGISKLSLAEHARRLLNKHANLCE